MATTQMEFRDAARRVLEPLYAKAAGAMTRDEVKHELGVNEEESERFERDIDLLEDMGALLTTKKGRLMLPSASGLRAGSISAAVRGFAFLRDDEPGRNDMFIPAGMLMGALNGDRVHVRHRDGKRGGEGEVERVIWRANSRILGTVTKESDYTLLIPDDVKLSRPFRIAKADLNGALPGAKVIAVPVSYAEGSFDHYVKVDTIVGNAGDVGLDIESIVALYALPSGFPPEVEAAADAAPEQVNHKDTEGREDLRDSVIFTIDGEDARDFDDAVSIDKLENGAVRLGVHIADVSNYVKAGSALDKEAFERGTSVYLTDRVIPMLPTKLSNGICSLNEGVDRLAVSVFMDIGPDGDVRSSRIARSVIRSKHRMTYTKVFAMIQGDEAVCEEYSDIAEDVSLMASLAERLTKRRMERGSLEFMIAESHILLDEAGGTADVKPFERNKAHMMIEEFMLLTNETVAKYFQERSMPLVYRVHEQPNEDKLRDLAAFFSTLGYDLDGGGKPASIQRVLNQARGSGEEDLINKLLLRSMMKARYSPDKLGHFGLASSDYCHFTSPIRRYPDLIVHRVLCEQLKGALDKKAVERWTKSLPNIADQCSELERRALEAERDEAAYRKAEFMLGHIGKQYEGVISGVAEYGLYVTLDSTVDGFVSIRSMDDDSYTYHEKLYSLIGRGTKKRYRLGDRLSVEVLGANVQTRTVDFKIAEGDSNVRLANSKRTGNRRDGKAVVPGKRGHKGRKDSVRRKTKRAGAPRR